MGDLRALVESQGLESALRQLREADVYVTFEEFKGRTPICRKGVTIPVTASDFDNPVARRDFSLSTGGSTGLANAVYQDLGHIRDLAVNDMIGFDGPWAYRYTDDPLDAHSTPEVAFG